MRTYETIFILNPDLGEDDLKGLIEKVRDIIQSLQGEVLKTEEWGRNRLAYNVKKMSTGHFVLLRFEGTSQALVELERNLRLMDAVLKYQTVRLDERKEKKAQVVSEERISPKEEGLESHMEENIEKSPQVEGIPQEAAGEEVSEARAEKDED